MDSPNSKESSTSSDSNTTSSSRVSSRVPPISTGANNRSNAAATSSPVLSRFSITPFASSTEISVEVSEDCSSITALFGSGWSALDVPSSSFFSRFVSRSACSTAFAFAFSRISLSFSARISLNSSSSNRPRPNPLPFGSDLTGSPSSTTTSSSSELAVSFDESRSPESGPSPPTDSLGSSSADPISGTSVDVSLTLLDSSTSVGSEFSSREALSSFAGSSPLKSEARESQWFSCSDDI